MRKNLEISKNEGVYHCFFRRSPKCILESPNRDEFIQVIQRGNKVLICSCCLLMKTKEGRFKIVDRKKRGEK